MARCIKGMCAAVLLVCGAPVFAADVYETVFALAQRLEQNGAHKEAATEYKRYLFLQDFSAGVHSAESYTALSRYYGSLTDDTSVDAPALALNYTRLALRCETDAPRIRALRRQEMDLLLARAQKDGSTLQQEPTFFSYLHLTDFSEDVRAYAWCTLLEHYLQTDQLDAFEQSFLYAKDAFPALFTVSQQEAIFSALGTWRAFTPKSLTAARWLSLFPGLGQLYACDYTDAFNAFALNGALIAFSVYSLVTFHWWDFSLIAFSPLLRFYRGNLYNAQKDAYYYNERKTAAYRAPLLEIVRAAKKTAW